MSTQLFKSTPAVTAIMDRITLTVTDVSCVSDATYTAHLDFDESTGRSAGRAAPHHRSVPGVFGCLFAAQSLQKCFAFFPLFISHPRRAAHK